MLFPKLRVYFCRLGGSEPWRPRAVTGVNLSFFAFQSFVGSAPDSSNERVPRVEFSQARDNLTSKKNCAKRKKTTKLTHASKYHFRREPPGFTTLFFLLHRQFSPHGGENVP